MQDQVHATHITNGHHAEDIIVQSLRGINYVERYEDGTGDEGDGEGVAEQTEEVEESLTWYLTFSS